MREQAFSEYCKSRGMNEAQIAEAVESVCQLETHLSAKGRSLETITAREVQDYVDALIEAGLNSYDRILALIRYFRLADLNEAFIHLVGAIGGQPIFPSIARRTEELAGSKVRAAVFEGLEEPPLGAGQQAYPRVTSSMLQRLQSQVPVETCRRILAANHHQVPRASFEPLRALYLSEGIDAVLARRHETLLAELEEHARTGKPWYEQLITPEVVEFVRANREIQAGVRHGNKIVVAKIPYDPPAYLATTDHLKRRYYQCHCPLARAGILEQGQGVGPTFCYCSGGYEKLPFDVVFGQETEVELLESALGGSERCRFAITIPGEDASGRDE